MFLLILFCGYSIERGQRLTITYFGQVVAAPAGASVCAPLMFTYSTSSIIIIIVCYTSRQPYTIKNNRKKHTLNQHINT